MASLSQLRVGRWATSRSGKPDGLRLVRKTVPLRVNQADVARMASSRMLSRAMLHKGFYPMNGFLFFDTAARVLDKKSYVGVP